jgi:hypothetical protein
LEFAGLLRGILQSIAMNKIYAVKHNGVEHDLPSHRPGIFSRYVFVFPENSNRMIVNMIFFGLKFFSTFPASVEYRRHVFIFLFSQKKATFKMVRDCQKPLLLPRF